MRIIITQDSSNEILKIEKLNGILLYEGDFSDFCREGDSVKQFFDKLGLDSILVEKNYDDWENKNES